LTGEAVNRKLIADGEGLVAVLKAFTSRLDARGGRVSPLVTN